MAKQRKFVRAQASLSVTEAGRHAVFRTRDISMGGMFIEMPRPWEEGSEHDVVVRHRAGTLDARVVVMSVVPEGVGVEFAGADKDFAARLKSFLMSVIFEADETDEDRGSPRFAALSLVAFMDSTGEYKGTIVDLSTTGARILADVLPEMGTTLYLYIPLFDTTSQAAPQLREMHGTTATVRRHLEGGFAVEFDSPSETFMKTVARILEANPESRIDIKA